MPDDTKPQADRLKETASRLFSEWADLARAAIDETEKFVKEKPVTSACAAFVVGWVLSSMFRK